MKNTFTWEGVKLKGRYGRQHFHAVLSLATNGDLGFRDVDVFTSAGEGRYLFPELKNVAIDDDMVDIGRAIHKTFKEEDHFV